MAIDSGGGGGGAKKQRVDELDDRFEAAGSDAIREDRISALPEELRLHVLTDLPLKDAIRTGALARGWRDLWKRRSAHRGSLEVHVGSNDDLRRELNSLERQRRPRRRLDFCSLIVETSKLRSSELRRFLDYAAAEYGVEYLHVETRSSSAAAKLKFHLPLLSMSPALGLGCLSLRDITLSMFYKGTQRPFDALEVIRLVSVSFRPEAFTKMMAVCPNLLTLDLRRCKCNGDNWKSYWPPLKVRRILGRKNLRNLTIEDCYRITTLDFVSVPNLRSFRYRGSLYSCPSYIFYGAALSDLYIQFYDDSIEWERHTLRRCLPKDLSSLRVLTMCHKTLTGALALSANGTCAQFPNFSLHSLKELHLLMFEMKAVNLSNLYLFFKTFQCPHLERLFVQLPTCRDETMEGSIDQVWEEPPEHGLDNLVMVKIVNFNWCPTEVRLVSFLLRKATSLRELLIVSRNVTRMDSLGAPEADLSLFNEALVNGKIVLTESDSGAAQPYHEAFIKVL